MPEFELDEVIKTGIGGTGVVISASKKLVRDAILQANTANTDNIFVGPSGVSTDSLALAAGESIELSQIDLVNGSGNFVDLNKIYVLSDGTSQKVVVTFAKEV